MNLFKDRVNGEKKSISFMNEVLDYDNRAEFYNGYESTLIDFIGVKPQSNILYLGCGKGFIAELLFKNLNQETKESLKITCVDIEPDFLHSAHEILSKYSNNLEFILSDVNKLPFANESFDVVLSHTLIKWMSEPEETVKEMKRVLKKSGTLMLGERVLPAIGQEIDRIDQILKQRTLDSLDKAPNPRIALSLPNILYEQGLDNIKAISFSNPVIHSLSNQKKTFIHNILWVKANK